MKNNEVAALFRELADMLEIQGENPFRIRAYQKASQTIEALGEDIEAVAARGELASLPGIGKDLAAKIEEILSSGRLAALEDMRQKVPSGLLEILAVPGLGPKMAKRLYDELGIRGLDDLERAAREGKLQTLSGIRAKTEAKILHGIDLFRKGRERVPLGFVLPIAEDIQRSIAAQCRIEHISPAGSVRRMRETVKDLDILVVARPDQPVMEAFLSRPDIGEVIAAGETKTSVRLKDGLQVDVRLVDGSCFGSALCYFTGSKAHNIRVRERGVKMGLKINEYGVFRGEARIAGATEQEVYEAVGLPFIEPELREDRGEIEAAQAGRLPRLVRSEDLKGDLHVHSRYSDGTATLEEIARAAERAGLEWVGVCDHSRSLRIGRGLSIDDVHRKIEEIRRINRAGTSRVLLLAGAEVDILSDGSLDYPDEVLEELDLVIAALHTGFSQDEKRLTERMISAMENPFVHMIAHPTGRLFGERDPYALDLERVLEAARRTGTALEINAYPKRLDLGDVPVRRAKDVGVLAGIGTDSHQPDQLRYLSLGLGVARRAWLEPHHLINTISKKEIRPFLSRMKRHSKG
jgi:DNA polymerase (family 10)